MKLNSFPMVLTRCLIVATALGMGASVRADEYVSDTPAANRFPLADVASIADIHVSEDDWKVAKIAAGDLLADVERVTGRRPALKHTTDGLSASAVLIGTIGRSRVIDGLIAAGKMDGMPVLLEGPPPRYPDDVLTNLRRFTTKLTIDRPGRHTLTVWRVDPGVIVDKAVLHTHKPVDSYLGPPESFHATPNQEIIFRVLQVCRASRQLRSFLKSDSSKN